MTITWWKQPHLIVYYFILCCYEQLTSLVKKKYILIVGPVLVVGTLLTHVYFPFATECLTTCLWWFFLGVAASIGVGTGLHSGVLFLFPYLIQLTHDDPSLTFDFWLQALLPSMIWGAGTACGEIPPFVLARAASLASINQKERDHQLQQSINADSSLWCFRQLRGMQNWMMQIIKRLGFYAILGFASWPNMAFDLCGIICGYYLIPFKVFFLATFIGKTFIKANIQCLVIVWICHPSWATSSISKLFAYFGDSSVIEFLDNVQSQLMNWAQQTLGQQHGTSFKINSAIFLWHLLSTVAVLCFVGSSTQKIAQSYYFKKVKVA